MMAGRLALAALAAFLAWPGAAAERVSLSDSFPVGSGPGALCTAQYSGSDPALSDMFDRGYALVCRDAAVPVGRLYALKLRGEDPGARLAMLRAGKVECAPSERMRIEGLGEVEALACRLNGADVGYRVYLRRERGTLYAAEGLGGYDSALRLGLRSLVADAPVAGELSIAVTQAGDPAAFARVQAGALDPARILAEAYRRNNAGSYAEAAEFFGAVLARPGVAGEAEALLNAALQQSNLGSHAEAARLFAQAAPRAGDDPVLTRMLRNYRAIHAMNQRRPREALAELDRPLPPGAAIAPPPAGAIDARTAAQLRAEAPASRQLRAAETELLPEERAQILDAQAQHLRGTLLGRRGDRAGAAAALDTARAGLAAVRGGRIVSTMWMQAQIHGELADLAEAGGDASAAQAGHEQAVALLAAFHPGSAAWLGAQARLAAWQARAGRTEEALALFGRIVDAGAQLGESSPVLRNALEPYFALLARQPDRPDRVAALFKASQLLVRPGVAQTQAVLARELSGGSDEAARLFRQSVNLGRDIERLRVEAARLAALPEPDPARLAEARARLSDLEQAQVATQSKLAEYPRYRVLSDGAMTLDELQQLLRPGEAYYKMTMVGGDGYAVFATPTIARAFRIGAGADELEREVDALRATIALVEEGRVLTYPFDLELAHRLFGQLFGPVSDELASVRHLVFEPDGAMLRLPPNLLVADRSGIRAYRAKAARPGDEGFDFTDVRWLGRDRDVSTAVSARAFRDVRTIAPSRAAASYLGFGENLPPPAPVVAENAVRGLLGERPDCAFPLGDWARPISADELVTASNSLEQAGGSGTEIVTGAGFTDSAIKRRSDLDDYRILHFATHGVVTAPRPECPARPALLTSFGGEASDGLLTFSEIFDLKLDADLIILSACDTAGKASLAVTREAGIATGGGSALDGLVRAFVGAGGRSVIASHWPVPDDYDATERLISGLFTAPPGTTVGTALRRAQAELMAQPDTSHPYYWAGFAIIGDGAAALVPRS